MIIDRFLTLNDHEANTSWVSSGRVVFIRIISISLACLNVDHCMLMSANVSYLKVYDIKQSAGSKIFMVGTLSCWTVTLYVSYIVHGWNWLLKGIVQTGLAERRPSQSRRRQAALQRLRRRCHRCFTHCAATM